MLWCIDNEGCSMQYVFIADESAARDETQTSSAAADCNALELITPRAWVAKGNPRLCESSLDLHHGLDVSEAEIDTVPAELLKDLFKL
jgi:hypothetical protein